MMRVWVLVLVLVVGLAGCSKCGPKAAAPVNRVERVLPKGAVAVVVVPAPQALGGKVTQLERLKVAGFVAQLQGFANGTGFVDALMAQVGLDVRKPEAFAAAGVDGARALGVALTVTTDVVLALPVADEAKLSATLSSLAKRRLGAGVAVETVVGAVKVKGFAVAAGQPAQVAWAVHQGYALVAVGSAVSQLAALGALAENDSLATDPALAQSLAGATASDVYVWLPAGSPALMQAPLTSAFVTAKLSATALTIDVAGKPKGEGAWLRALEPKAGAVDVTGSLPADAFAVGIYRGDAMPLEPFVSQVVGPLITQALQGAALDVKQEVLANLKPGTSFALSLADKPPMDRGLPTLDIRQTNPFSYAHLTGIAPVVTADSVAVTLDKVVVAGPRFGAKVVSEVRGGQKLYLTTWAQGEGVHFAAKADRLVFASPVPRLEAALAALSTPKPPVALPTGGVAVAVDLRALSESVRALPDSAWGLGGFAMKATTVRWLEATDDLKALTLSGSSEGGTARLALTLVLEASKATP